MKLSFAQRAGWLAHLYKASFQQHHSELVQLLKPFIPDEAVVVDVGGHAGQFAKLFAKLARGGRVYCFEPSPYALSILRPALKRRNLEQIHVLQSEMDAVMEGLERKLEEAHLAYLTNTDHRTQDFKVLSERGQHDTQMNERQQRALVLLVLLLAQHGDLVGIGLLRITA